MTNPVWRLFVNYDVIPLHVMLSSYFEDYEEKLLDVQYTHQVLFGSGHVPIETPPKT